MELVPVPSPQDPELARLHIELGRLERDMAQREAELAEARAAVQAFELRYWQAFGALIATLDELEASAAEGAARLDPADQTKRRKAERLRARAEGLVPAPEPEERVQPDDELKTVYRTLSKRVHPDLAATDAERARREALMAKVNEAYRRGDVALLSQLLLGQEPGADRPRLEAQLRAVQQRLARAEAERVEVEGAAIARLMRHEARARAEGRDLFARWRRELEASERELRKRVKALQRRLDRRAGTE